MLCWGSVEQARREHMSQANKKSVYYCSASVTPIMGTHRDTKTRQWSIKEQTVKEVKRMDTGFPNTYHAMKLRKPTLASCWSQKSTNLSAFWNLIR